MELAIISLAVGGRVTPAIQGFPLAGDIRESVTMMIAYVLIPSLGQSPFDLGLEGDCQLRFVVGRDCLVRLHTRKRFLCLLFWKKRKT